MWEALHPGQSSHSPLAASTSLEVCLLPSRAWRQIRPGWRLCFRLGEAVGPLTVLDFHADGSMLPSRAWRQIRPGWRLCFGLE